MRKMKSGELNVKKIKNLIKSVCKSSCENNKSHQIKPIIKSHQIKSTHEIEAMKAAVSSGVTSELLKVCKNNM